MLECYEGMSPSVGEHLERIDRIFRRWIVKAKIIDQGRHTAVKKLQTVDFVYNTLGVRMVGDYAANITQVVCAGVLSYADEDKRTVADVVCV